MDLLFSKFNRDWRERIRDILDAIAEIQKFTRGMDFESFRADDKSIRAVEMNFIIIGEAASQIPEEVEEKISRYSVESHARHAESDRARLLQN